MRFTIPDCPAVLDLLAGYLATDLGHAELERLEFLADRAELERLHRRNAEAQLWLQRRGSFGFSALDDDPGALLDQARLPGLGLAALELLQILRFLDAAAALREHVVVDSDGAAAEAPLWPQLAELGRAIPVCAEIRRALHAALLPNGELADDASPELARLRRQRGRQRQAIEASLAQHLRRLGGEGVLQDELITMRHERFVLPVRTDLRRRAPGVVHGASSSGQTVFVEPLETIELNNEHIRLIEAEQTEVRRILVELTARIGAEVPAIRASARICGVLELESAKARFATDFAAHPAEFSSPGEDGADPELECLDARHPVLVASLRGNRDHAVVPLSLRLERQRLLVISGPNTGGKTVVLKTIGMAAWMAQCGLPVCARHARLPVFRNIAADVGDVQSLQQNLSTFSSHLTHIRDILREAGPDSLVLLDELGTATNAAEGAALAVEIAEFLIERRAWTLISTHHDSLKAWASTHPETVVNGSVAVDPETLAPSYQFRLGVPGLSAGLDMAARLGLPPKIIAGARGRLTQDERQAADYLQRLQRNLAEAEDRLGEVETRERTVTDRERTLAAHDRTYQQRQMAALRADMERRLAAFTASAETHWRRALEGLQTDLTSAQKRKIAVAAAKMKRETATAFQGEVGSIFGDRPAETDARLEPQPGDRIRVRALSQPATVLRRLPEGGLEIEAGALRMQIDSGEVTAIVAASRPAPRVSLPEAPAVREINLIGLRMEEAVEKLEKFLDQAILAETDQIRIVHGAGFGVLRKAVADALRIHPQVASYSHPPQNQGGTGVTIAVLK